MFFGIDQIECNHFFHHLVEHNFRHPDELFFGVGRVGFAGIEDDLGLEGDDVQEGLREFANRDVGAGANVVDGLTRCSVP